MTKSQRWKSRNKEQCRTYRKKYYLEHRDAELECSRKYHQNNKRLRHQYDKLYRATMQGRVKHWKSEAKRKGVAWALSQKDLERLPLSCAYTGVPLTLEPGLPNTVSLDRIEGSRGYVAGNVVFCTTTVNVMKFNQSTSEFVGLCKLISERYEKIRR